MRLLAALLVAAALAGCAERGSDLLFDMHIAHDFEEAPRAHGFATGDDADRLVVHLQLSPKPGATCDPATGPPVSITLRRTPNETIARAARVDQACRLFDEHVVAVEGRALWTIEFEGQGAYLGGADVTAESTGTSFRLPR